MSVAQTNYSILKQTIQKQEVQINVLKHDYAELKKKYDALVQQTQNQQAEEAEPEPEPEP